MEPTSEADGSTVSQVTGSLPPPTYIRSTDGWEGLNLAELWDARELLYFLTLRSVKVRYKQTALGVAWAVLQPTLMMVVFSLFLGNIPGVASSDVPYPVFVFAGLLPWTFFATAVTAAAGSVVESERLVTKVYFPRLALPFSAVAAALVDFVIAFCVLLLLMAYYGIVPGVSVLLLPGLIVLVVLAALAVGMFLAALNVLYRDFRYVVGFLMQIWMLATPSIYLELDSPDGQPSRATVGSSVSATLTRSGVDEDTTQSSLVRGVAQLNPMNGVIAAFRAAILNRPVPWTDLIVSSIVIAVGFLAGCYCFRRIEDSFADVI